MRAANYARCVALLSHFVYRVFPQDVGSAAASPSSATTDRARVR